MPTETLPVSIIVMTRNEAANIEHCLRALEGFDEVFVVDSSSTDDTVDKARMLGAVVIPFVWNGQYPKKKQWCLENLSFRNDWVLFVDADEQITAGLKGEITQMMSSGMDKAGYYISGRPVFAGHALRFGQHNLKLALLDRHRCRFLPCDDLHVMSMWEVEGHYQPQTDGPVGRLRGYLLHHDSKSFAHWVERHNRYSDWEATVRHQGQLVQTFRTEPLGRRTLKSVFNALPLKPLWVFLYGYVLRLGLLDGQAGLHYALARAFYYWLISAKTFERQMLADQPPVPVNRKSSSCPLTARSNSTTRLRTAESEI